MKKSNLTRGLLITICTLSLAGCGMGSENPDTAASGQTPLTSAAGQPDNVSEPKQDNGSDDKSETGDGAKSGSGSETESATEKGTMTELLDSALAHGSVVDFSEAGCKITPIEDDGESMVVAASPEFADSAENIEINYETDCEYQIALSDVATGETTFSAASISDIKKQTNILVYGEKQDSGAIMASKIIIWRNSTDQ